MHLISEQAVLWFNMLATHAESAMLKSFGIHLPHALVRLMTGTRFFDCEHVRIVHSCVKRGGPVRTVTDGIKERGLVLVARNQVDEIRQITRLSHFVKTGSCNNSTGLKSLCSDQLMPYG